MTISIRHITWSEIMRFIFFVLLATLMWFGHAMQSVRTTRVPVLIQYTGKPNTIGLDGKGLPDTVLIEVRDIGARLNMYHRDPLHLTIDLRQYIHGEKGTIRVPSDALRRSISDILQGTSQLIDTHPEEITCGYFTEQEKSVAVVLDAQMTPATGYQFVGDPRLSRTYIKLYGRDRALSAIDEIKTEPLTLTGLSDTTVIAAPLAIPQGMRAETDSITIRIIAERFTEKKFTIPVRVENAPEGYQLLLFPHEVEVSVRMGMQHFAKVQASDIRAVCTYSPDRKDKLDVTIQYTNPYITAAWAYPGVVEFLLEQ